MRWLASRYLRGSLALLGVGFIAYSLLQDGLPLDQLWNLAPKRIGLASVTVVVAVLAAALAWSAIVERPFKFSGRIVLESLPAKYVPGGLGLPLSQLNFETSQGDGVNRTLARLLQNFLVSVAAGGTASLVLHGLQKGTFTWEIPLAMTLALAIVLAHPDVLNRVPLPSRVVGVSFAPWSQVSIAFGVSLAALLVLGFGYQSVLDGMLGEPHQTASAFLLAWTIGFAAVPVPAGLGLRESVLVAVLASLPTSTVVLAALVFRLIAIAAELVVSAVAHLTPQSREHLSV